MLNEELQKFVLLLMGMIRRSVKHIGNQASSTFFKPFSTKVTIVVAFRAPSSKFSEDAVASTLPSWTLILPSWIRIPWPSTFAAPSGISSRIPASGMKTRRSPTPILSEWSSEPCKNWPWVLPGTTRTTPTMMISRTMKMTLNPNRRPRPSLQRLQAPLSFHLSTDISCCMGVKLSRYNSDCHMVIPFPMQKAKTKPFQDFFELHPNILADFDRYQDIFVHEKLSVTEALKMHASKVLSLVEDIVKNSGNPDKIRSVMQDLGVHHKKQVQKSIAYHIVNVIIVTMDFYCLGYQRRAFGHARSHRLSYSTTSRL